MIPEFTDGLNLPVGAHLCLWAELVDRFCFGTTREVLCRELRNFFDRANDCGFRKVLIWGSFPTAKPNPRDLDLLFVLPRGMTQEGLEPGCAELLDHIRCKDRYGHDFFICYEGTEGFVQLSEGFSYDRNGRRRGVLLLDLPCQ